LGGEILTEFQRSALGAFIRSPLGQRNGLRNRILKSLISGDYVKIGDLIQSSIKADYLNIEKVIQSVVNADYSTIENIVQSVIDADYLTIQDIVQSTVKGDYHLLLNYLHSTVKADYNVLANYLVSKVSADYSVIYQNFSNSISANYNKLYQTIQSNISSNYIKRETIPVCLNLESLSSNIVLPADCKLNVSFVRTTNFEIANYVKDSDIDRVFYRNILLATVDGKPMTLDFIATYLIGFDRLLLQYNPSFELSLSGFIDGINLNMITGTSFNLLDFKITPSTLLSYYGFSFNTFYNNVQTAPSALTRCKSGNIVDDFNINNSNRYETLSDLDLQVNGNTVKNNKPTPVQSNLGIPLVNCSMPLWLGAGLTTICNITYDIPSNTVRSHSGLFRVAVGGAYFGSNSLEVRYNTDGSTVVTMNGVTFSNNGNFTITREQTLTHFNFTASDGITTTNWSLDNNNSNLPSLDTQTLGGIYLVIPALRDGPDLYYSIDFTTTGSVNNVGPPCFDLYYQNLPLNSNYELEYTNGDTVELVPIFNTDGNYMFTSIVDTFDTGVELLDFKLPDGLFLDMTTGTISGAINDSGVVTTLILVKDVVTLKQRTIRLNWRIQ
jgi:hypothetical protein